MTSQPSQLTVVVPVWHDDEALAGLLQLLRGWHLPVVVVDGASASSTASVTGDSHLYVSTAASRGAQIAVGVDRAVTSWVWVLHADTRPSLDALSHLKRLIADGKPRWGRFDVALPGLAPIGFLMNWRSRLTKICTGDQAMFFHTQLLGNIGGFPRQPLMEDIEVSKRLKAHCPECFDAAHVGVESSSRRWLNQGVWRTILSMWIFRVRYFFGAQADDLVVQYYHSTSAARNACRSSSRT